MFIFFITSLLLFIIGAFGVFLSRKDFIIILISLELMLLAVNWNFVIFSVFLDDILGQIYALIVLTVAASESSLGLALLIVYFRLRGGILIDLSNLLKA